MTKLYLELDSNRTEWISGETPRFWIKLTNKGTDLINVPTVFSGGFLTINMTDLLTGEEESFSQGMPDLVRRPDRQPLPHLYKETELEPGSTTRYYIDLDNYAPSLPVVGKYELQIELKTESIMVESETFIFSVTPLRPTVWNSVTDYDENLLRQVVLHRETSGRVALVRESVAGHAASKGFYRFAEALSPKACAAISIPLRSLLNSTVAATISDGILITGSIGSEIVVETPIGLDEPYLHPFGWQIDDDTSEFLILGSDGDKVHAFFVHYDELGGGIVKIDKIQLPIETVPNLWHAQRFADKAEWILAYGKNSTLYRMRLDRNGASDPELLTEERGSLNALAMYPIAAASPESEEELDEDEPNYSSEAPVNIIDSLFGPYEEDDQSMMLLQRVNTMTGEIVESLRFPLPEGTPKKGLDWNLSILTGEEPFVTALFGNRLFGVGEDGIPADLFDEMTGTRGHTLDWFRGTYLHGWTTREGNPIFHDSR